MKLAQDPSSLEALLARLLDHPLPTIALGLERVRRFLGYLGDPQLRLPPVVHVAGTNGKGSVLAYMRAMLEAGGYTCHVYTSPHLVRFNERIVVAGHEIDDEALSSLLWEVIQVSEVFPATFFETTTAAAFLAFSRTPADIVLLETGMGGRLDATNLVPHPALTVIMPISLDHTEFLGDTLAKIAWEKAGIIKAGAPCVVGPQEEEALAVIEARAQELGAPLVVYGRNFAVEEGGYVSASLRLPSLVPALPGAFQYANAAVAVAGAQTLMQRFPLTVEAMRAGVTQAVWPARLQRMEPGALTEALGEGRRLWLDGGHNPAAAQALASWLRARAAPVHLVWGMLADKDAQGYIAALAPYLASVTAVPVPGEQKSADPERLAAAAASCSLRAGCAADMEDALRSLRARVPEGADILIGGSLYLAGAALAKNRRDTPRTMI